MEQVRGRCGTILHVSRLNADSELEFEQTDRISDGQQKLPASIVLAHLQPGQREILSGRRWVWGRKGLCLSLTS